MSLIIDGIGTGASPVVNLTFPYLDKSHVRASVNGAEVALTWTGASQVTFTAPVPSGASWLVYRQTPIDHPLVDFVAGAVLTEDLLDRACAQVRYRQEEVEALVDFSSVADTAGLDGRLDFLENKQRTYVNELPGVVEGVVSDAQRASNTVAINLALALGKALYIRAGTRIELGATLVMPSGSALIGERGGAKPVLYMPLSKFNNSDNVGNRYGSNAVGISFSGQSVAPYAPTSGVRMENFKLDCDPTIGRYLRGIVGQNVVDCQIVDVEVCNFPTGIGICLASAKRIDIISPYIHHFFDSTNWATLPQLTGIEIDNDPINGIASEDIVIDRPRITDLTVSGGLFTTWGYQTDGINIARKECLRTKVSNATIRNVGEGIDNFGCDGVFTNITIENTQIFGFKFIHGASRNVVNGLTIRNSGLAGLVFSGSNSAPDTAGNIVHGLTVMGLRTNGTWASADVSCVLVQDNGGGTGKPVNNLVNGAYLDCGTGGNYGWLDTSTGGGNYGVEVRVLNSVDRKVFVPSGGGAVRRVGQSTFDTNV